MSSGNFNKVLTTVNTFTNNYSLIPDPTKTIVIDTSDCRIGINTYEPEYEIHVSGGTIKTTYLDLSNGFVTSHLIPDTSKEDLTLTDPNSEYNFTLTNRYNLGSHDKPWNKIYCVSGIFTDVDISPQTLYMGGIPVLRLDPDTSDIIFGNPDAKVTIAGQVNDFSVNGSVEISNDLDVTNTIISNTISGNFINISNNATILNTLTICGNLINDNLDNSLNEISENVNTALRDFNPGGDFSVNIIYNDPYSRAKFGFWEVPAGVIETSHYSGPNDISWENEGVATILDFSDSRQIYNSAIDFDLSSSGNLNLYSSRRFFVKGHSLIENSNILLDICMNTDISGFEAKDWGPGKNQAIHQNCVSGGYFLIDNYATKDLTINITPIWSGRINIVQDITAGDGSANYTIYDISSKYFDNSLVDLSTSVFNNPPEEDISHTFFDISKSIASSLNYYIDISGSSGFFVSSNNSKIEFRADPNMYEIKPFFGNSTININLAFAGFAGDLIIELSNSGLTYNGDRDNDNKNPKITFTLKFNDNNDLSYNDVSYTNDISNTIADNNKNSIFTFDLSTNISGLNISEISFNNFISVGSSNTIFIDGSNVTITEINNSNETGILNILPVLNQTGYDFSNVKLSLILPGYDGSLNTIISETATYGDFSYNIRKNNGSISDLVSLYNNKYLSSYESPYKDLSNNHSLNKENVNNYQFEISYNLPPNRFMYVEASNAILNIENTNNFPSNTRIRVGDNSTCTITPIDYSIKDISLIHFFEGFKDQIEFTHNRLGNSDPSGDICFNILLKDKINPDSSYTLHAEDISKGESNVSFKLNADNSNNYEYYLSIFPKHSYHDLSDIKIYYINKDTNTSINIYENTNNDTSYNDFLTLSNEVYDSSNSKIYIDSNIKPFHGTLNVTTTIQYAYIPSSDTHSTTLFNFQLISGVSNSFNIIPNSIKYTNSLNYNTDITNISNHTINITNVSNAGTNKLILDLIKLMYIDSIDTQSNYSYDISSINNSILIEQESPNSPYYYLYPRARTLDLSINIFATNGESTARPDKPLVLTPNSEYSILGGSITSRDISFISNRLARITKATLTYANSSAVISSTTIDNDNFSQNHIFRFTISPADNASTAYVANITCKDRFNNEKTITIDFTIDKRLPEIECRTFYNNNPNTLQSGTYNNLYWNPYISSYESDVNVYFQIKYKSEAPGPMKLRFRNDPSVSSETVTAEMGTSPGKTTSEPHNASWGNQFELDNTNNDNWITVLFKMSGSPSRWTRQNFEFEDSYGNKQYYFKYASHTNSYDWNSQMIAYIYKVPLSLTTSDFKDYDTRSSITHSMGDSLNSTSYFFGSKIQFTIRCNRYCKDISVTSSQGSVDNSYPNSLSKDGSTVITINNIPYYNGDITITLSATDEFNTSYSSTFTLKRRTNSLEIRVHHILHANYGFSWSTDTDSSQKYATSDPYYIMGGFPMNGKQYASVYTGHFGFYITLKAASGFSGAGCVALGHWGSIWNPQGPDDYTPIKGPANNYANTRTNFNNTKRFTGYGAGDQLEVDAAHYSTGWHSWGFPTPNLFIEVKNPTP